MVVHIVMFKFKETNKQPNLIQAKQMLENLMGAVPSLRSMDVGINFSQEERAMDMSIITTFESKEGLEAYAVHPEHLKVVDFIKQVVEYSKVVDYERER
ncbi:MAG: Dabb family protein [Sulfurovum sp.]|nr:Dabb family protein [Sulfurovum sp.]